MIPNRYCAKQRRDLVLVESCWLARGIELTERCASSKVMREPMERAQLMETGGGLVVEEEVADNAKVLIFASN